MIYSRVSYEIHQKVKPGPRIPYQRHDLSSRSNHSRRIMTRRNPNHISARHDGAWDTHQRHETKANWIYFRREPSSIGNRDTTVPVTQCNRPCHVTLSLVTRKLHLLQTRSKHPLNTLMSASAHTFLAHVFTLIDLVYTHLPCTRLHLDRPRLHTPSLHTSSP
jgi:hypothetical protein